MNPDSDVEKLITRLKQSTSLTEQLKTVVRSWRMVRAMPREQRTELARQVGLSEASQLLERLGQPRGISPARLLRAVELAEKADSKELKELLSELRQPEGRGRVFDRGLDLLDTVLSDSAPPVPPVVAPSLVAVEEPVQIPSGPPDTEKERKPQIETPPPTVDRSKATAETDARSSGALAAKAVDEEIEEASEEDEGRREVPGEREVISAPPADLELGQERAQARRTPERSPGVPREESGELASSIARESSLVGRFRLLREFIEKSEGLADPETVLNFFVEGWARRRAYCSLVQSQAVTRDKAIELLAKISPASELFCVSSLLQTFAFSNTEAEELAGRVRTRAARRHILRVQLIGRH